MKNLTIAKRITFGFTILAGLVAIVGIVGYVGLKTVDTDADRLTSDSMPGALILGQAKDCLSLEFAMVERIASARTPEQVKAGERELTVIIDKDAGLMRDYTGKMVTQADKDFLARVAEKRNAYVADVDKFLSMANAGKTNTDEIHEFIDTDFLTHYKPFSGILDDYLKFNRENSERTAGSLQSNIDRAVMLIVIGVLVAMLLAGAIAWLIIRGTSKVLKKAIGEIEEGSAQVAAASSEVSSASNMLAEGASEQAASLEETSSSLEEMSSMTSQNAKSAQDAKGLADDMRKAADGCTDQMKQMQQAMDAIKESSTGISQIIKTIDEIAFQTNILALNAAVEAARAGEAGAGFAVVAEEVRNLAQRSAQSAKETSGKIEGAIHNSERGVAISGKVAESLGTIVEKAREMHALVTEIATASAEQDKGIGQLTSAVQQMDKVTQSNASNAEETASASEELNAHADSLKDTVVELVSLVRSDAGAKEGRSNARVGQAQGRTSVGVARNALERDTHGFNTKSSGKGADKQNFLPRS
jgi:methyl-accepting chemotaxis protein